MASTDETTRRQPAGAIASAMARSGPLAWAVVDALLPPRCLRCDALIGSRRGLCPDCWARLSFVVPPLCACCGTPFPYPQGPQALCAACIAAPPAYHRARAALIYDDGSRDLLLAFKHGDRLAGAALFGQWLGQAGQALLADAELVVPVPLHRWRLAKRRYNQAGLLASAAGRLAGRDVVPDLLQRVRATPSQGSRGQAARVRNVRGAFAVRPRHRQRLQGRRVLLVDDVLTSGATVEACARVLRRAGAGAVDVLTLSRVVRAASPSI